jgi:hypothetical protein
LTLEGQEATVESTSNVAPAEADSAAQERSSIQFPYLDLDAAVEVVRGVHNAGGTACDAEQLAAELKMEAKGGGFRTRISSAQIFGLISYERGGRVTLTDLGRQCLEPSTERLARMNAFLNVPLYSKVYEQFKGGPLPPQAGLERTIGSMGVGSKVRDRARQALLRSAKQAGFFDAAPDRLVRPNIKSETPPPGNDQGGDGSRSGNDGGNDGEDHLHPLIKGLLETLPKPGTEWEVQGRLDWLNMANSILKMIYKAGQNPGEIVVGLKPNSDKGDTNSK